jgi:carbon starvation protein
MPIAMVVGWLTYKRGVSLFWPSVVSLGLLYLAVWLGVYGGESGWRIELTPFSALNAYGTPVVVWTVLLLVYCFAASVLPVWLLLQPRDYINSHQLYVALALLVAGLLVAGLNGTANLSETTPMIASSPADAPPIIPFLFITIACGACSGFHCLVSSGTTSKQISSETDAHLIGYGSMLLEGMLAVLVILACCSGLGIGTQNEAGQTVTGAAAWESRYRTAVVETQDSAGQVVIKGGWKGFGLPQMVGAFVEGGANFIAAIGLPRELCVAIVAVLVACFAATTLDTSTRLQRYVIQELGTSLHIAPLANKYVATGVAVVSGGALALIDGGGGPGTGGLLLWPLFGATNQLLAGLALVVLVFYLARRGISLWFAAVPMLFMLVVPGWAMVYNLLYSYENQPLLFGFGVAILVLQSWMIIEAALLWPKVRGVLEPPLPPLPVVGNRPSG